MRSRCGNPAAGPGPALCRRNVQLQGLHDHGTPVAARRDEIPVGGGDLSGSRRAVPEQAPLVRAHLEEAEVLAVLGVGSQAGLAAGNGERLTGSSCRRPGRSRGAASLLDRGETPGLGAAREARCAPQPPSAAPARSSTCEAATAGSPRPRTAGRSATRRALRRIGAPAGPSSGCSDDASVGRRGRRSDCDWAVAGRINRIRAHAPIARALRSDLHLGDRAHGAGRKRAVRVSRCGHRSEPGTNAGADPYKILEFTVTIVVHRNNNCAPENGTAPSRGPSRRAAGQGLEPQLPEPESGVLPLDDPAGLARDGSNRCGGLQHRRRGL